MNTQQLATRTVIAAVAALILTTAGLLIARPAEAAAQSGRLADTAHYNGSVTTLSASYRGGYLTDITATIQLPRSYANNMRVVAMLQHNGPPAIRNGWWIQMVDRDTNGDARLTYRMGSLKVKRGDRVGVWYSDPVTRYRVTHPEFVVG